MTWPAQHFVVTDSAVEWSIVRDDAIRNGYKYHRSSRWSTDVDEVPDFPDEVYVHTDDDSVVTVHRGEKNGINYTAVCSWSGESVYVEVASPSDAVTLDVIAVFKEHMPELEATEGQVPVAFWFESPHGPTQISRMIDVATWADVAGNYTPQTRRELSALMSGFQPAVGGQLMLWQGKPGTGKTHALRALAVEWRGWADLHYIVDPDNLFGRSAHYLIQVLLSSSSSERWKVLVLEDTGELLAADAKAQTGQALSRLLNVVDGLIGQGLRVLVLVTTNEELKSLHPAVARPGRCAAQITFQRFTAPEARAWLKARGYDVSHMSTIDGLTLAEMYGRVGGRQEADTVSPRIGFGA